MPLRCVLVDDNEAFLETARLLLEREGLAIVGMASTIAGALRQVRALRPDLVLVDIGLGNESGFDLTSDDQVTYDLRVADQRQDGADGATVLMVRIGELLGHPGVPWLQICAFLRIWGRYPT